jgi:DNA-binding NarL/FixJ family response regulator
MKKKRILVADDHRIIVEGLRRILEPEYEVLGAVHDGRALVESVQRLKPDAVITDISMPLLNGMEAIRQIKLSDPRTKIIVLTMHTDAIYVTEAYEAGANAYVVKQSGASEMLSIVRNVFNGVTYNKNRTAEQPMSFPLTPRQREVLQLIAEGHQTKGIAQILNLSPRTADGEIEIAQRC